MAEQPTTAASAAPTSTAVTTATPTPAALSIFDPAQFDNIQRIGKAFINSKLVPDMYQYKPQPIPAGASEANIATIKQANEQAFSQAMSNCIVALDMAQRINANPLMVMQNLDIIYGRPAFRSTFLIATINSCGRFKPLKFRITQNGTVDVGGKAVPNLECYAYTTEKGSDEVLAGSRVSVAMAVQQGWYSRNGSKWPSMPEQMLQYRAAAFWQRIYAPEISMGMITTDEAYEVDAKPQVVDVPTSEVETIE